MEGFESTERMGVKKTIDKSEKGSEYKKDLEEQDLAKKDQQKMSYDEFKKTDQENIEVAERQKDKTSFQKDESDLQNWKGEATKKSE